MDTDTATRPGAIPTAGTATSPGTSRQRLVTPPEAIALALATLEALLGRRGLHQLRPWLSRSAFLQLVAHVDSGIFDRSVLGTLRTQMPTPRAVESTARISVDSRWLACTVRLDRAENWQCSDLMVLGTPSSDTVPPRGRGVVRR